MGRQNKNESVMMPVAKLIRAESDKLQSLFLLAGAGDQEAIEQITELVRLEKLVREAERVHGELKAKAKAAKEIVQQCVSNLRTAAHGLCEPLPLFDQDKGQSA